MAIVDGFELKFVSRTQSAERRLHGRLIDTIPVAWVASWRNGPPPPAPPVERQKPGATPPKAARKAPPRDAFVEIAFADADAMAAQKEPFVVALAQAKAQNATARGSVAEFRGVFEVAPTGVALSPTSIETKVLRRVTADAA